MDRDTGVMIEGFIYGVTGDRREGFVLLGGLGVVVDLSFGGWFVCR